MSGSIEQNVTIGASPQRVYEALTSGEKFSEFTGGAPAEIATAAGGAFSCFGGMISGRQIELVPGKRIVQAWRAGNWPEGVYSIATFELTSQGASTRVAFRQSGFPADNREHLEAGWHKMYWEPLNKYLG